MRWFRSIPHASARGVVLGAACGLVCWALARQPMARGLEDWFQDAGFAYRGTRATTTKIVIVALDDDSLAELPKPMTAASPELAEVVDYLYRQGSVAIGLDVFIPESLDPYDREPGLGGAAMGRAVARSGKVVLPAALGDGQRLVRPLSSWQTTSAFGLVEVTEDLDHFVRRQQVAATVGGEPFPSFALALLDVAGRDSAEKGALRVDGRAVPLDAEGCLRINYLGPPRTVRSVPFREVLQAARGRGPAPADFTGATVVIGATAKSLGDWHSTPYANGSWRLPWSRPPGLMAGPEVQAGTLATLADGAFITTPWWLAPLPWVLLVGAALGAAFARVGLARGAGLALAHHFGWKGLALAAFWYGHWRVEVLAMLATGAACYGVTFAFRWRWLRRMYGVARGEAIARSLEGNFGHLRRRGQVRVLTVLFSDVRGFTAFSEAHAHDPARVVALLNAYFTEMVPIVEAHGGSINQYMGDGLMAMFGAPGDQPGHASAAVQAAVAMVAKVHELERRWADLGFPGMKIGVGVNTGPAVVGTVGSPDRLDYTAIGDTVNAAARIESENKTFDSEVLVSRSTRDTTPAAEWERLELDPEPLSARVKGKGTPLTLFRVVVDGVGRRPTPTPEIVPSGPSTEELIP